MESQNFSSTDGIGRLLSLGALVVSLGGGFLLYQDNQQLRAKLSETATSPADGYEEFAEGWDTKLVGALSEFDKRANDSIQKFDSVREARNRLASAANQGQGVAGDGLSQADVEALIEKAMGTLKVATPEPELQVATLVMSPTSDGSPPLPAIRNVGSVDAEIKAVRFKPKKGSEFVVEKRPQVSKGDVIIEFSPENNLNPKTIGAHRFYQRDYILPEQVVPANTTVPVLIEIRANNRHLDWGMKGDLELEYQDGRSVRISEAQAIFVPDPEETA